MHERFACVHESLGGPSDGTYRVLSIGSLGPRMHSPWGLIKACQGLPRLTKACQGLCILGPKQKH